MNDQNKWNQKYSEKLQDMKVPEPNPRLKKIASYLSGGKALDLACGLGANSIFLAQLDYQVEAIDISDVAIRQLHELAAQNNLIINARVCDLTNEKLGETGQFDLIVMTYYLDRSLFPALTDLIKDKGYFFMETFYQTPGTDGRGVSNRYKLLPKELLNEFTDWKVIFFEEHEQEGRQTIFCQKQ